MNNSPCIIERADGRFVCSVLGVVLAPGTKPPIRCACGSECKGQHTGEFPSLARQAWNLAGSLAAFVADGFATVTENEYRKRLEICDGCEFRMGTRCQKCGCQLALKAKGRAFHCPENKWPAISQDRDS